MIFVILIVNSCKTSKSIIVAPSTEIIKEKVISINGDSVNKATVIALELTNVKLSTALKKLAKLDSSFMYMQSAIAKNTESVTYYNSTTNIYKTTDSIRVDTIGQNFVYSSKLYDKWFIADIIASKDSTQMRLQIHNPFTITHNKVNKPFGTSQHRVSVTAQNPYTDIKEAQSIFKDKKKASLSVGVMTNHKLYFLPTVGFNYGRSSVKIGALFGKDRPIYMIGAEYKIF